MTTFLLFFKVHFLNPFFVFIFLKAKAANRPIENHKWNAFKQSKDCQQFWVIKALKHGAT